jgi:predicted Zn-dependent peptidase
LSQSEIYTQHLPNGLTLVAEPIAGIRSAAFQFLIPAGAATEPEGQEGASTVLEGLSYRGAGGKDTRALSDALDSLGLQRSGGAELEHTSFGGALLADDLLRALELYADVLRRPALPADEFEQERELAGQRLARLDDSPTEKLFVELRRTYFPGPHGRTALGAREGLAALSPESVRQDHARRYRPQGAILSVAGAFHWEELQQAVHRLFGDWEGVAPATPPPATAGRSGYRHVPQETSQEQIGVAYPSAGLGSEGYYEARMAVEVLSGGMAARLFTEVREKRGLVYSVRAVQQSIKGAGFILAYAGTTPERCQETVDVLVGELRRVAEGVTDEELARARTGLLSALIMQGESTRARAGALGRDQYLLSRVRSLSEIRRAVEQVTTESIWLYLRDHPPADFTVVTLGPRDLEVTSDK